MKYLISIALIFLLFSCSPSKRSGLTADEMQANDLSKIGITILGYSTYGWGGITVFMYENKKFIMYTAYDRAGSIVEVK